MSTKPAPKTKPKPKSKPKPCAPNFGLPKGVKPHNPDNLTPEQVGEGWRLMAASEIRESRDADYGIQCWLYGDWDQTGWTGKATGFTYRVPADWPVNWDLPSEHKTQSASTHQEGGEHYKSLVIQPAEFITRNKLSFLEGCVVKRVCRHRAKNGAEDIRKAIHELQLILELEYGTK